jgi:hypothetical protein
VYLWGKFRLAVEALQEGRTHGHLVLNCPCERHSGESHWGSEFLQTGTQVPILPPAGVWPSVGCIFTASFNFLCPRKILKLSVIWWTCLIRVDVDAIIVIILEYIWKSRLYFDWACLCYGLNYVPSLNPTNSYAAVRTSPVTILGDRPKGSG